MKSGTLVITGWSGFLGSRLRNSLTEHVRVIPAPRDLIRSGSAEELEQFLRRHRPDAVIHCAALSDTGLCETNPAQSFHANVALPGRLARACAAAGTRLVAMSSDQVYNGVRSLEPSSEEVSLAPVSVYGRHKLEAERAVLSACPDAVILRLTWLFDLPVRGLKTNRNLLTGILDAAVTGSPASYFVHDFRGMTYTQDLISAFGSILSLPGGIYNTGSTNTLSTYDTVIYTASLLRIPNPEVLIQRNEDAFRDSPRNLTMSGEKLAAAGIRFPDTKEAIARCLSDFGLLRQGSDV